MAGKRSTGTAVEQVERHEVVVPGTGEVIDLAQPAQVAGALEALRAFKQQLTDVEYALAEALIQESERQGTKTLHFDTVTAEIRGGRSTEYDPEFIEAGLRKAGMPEERIKEVVVETVERKVSAAKAKQAAGASPAYRKVIERGSVEVSKRQTVATRPR